MANIIQLKTGTGSAVPSSLTQGELAINVDNGLFYYGSGSTSVKKLESFTHITSSGNISASGTITALSMSGDGSGLTNISSTVPAGTISSSQHIFTAITASGNISSSGTIYGDILQIQKGATFNVNQNPAYDFKVRSENKNYMLYIDANKDRVGIGHNSPNPNDLSSSLHIAGDLTTDSHISASGNISSSGTSTGSFGRVESDTFAVTTFSPDTISTTNVTASSNISASGNLYGNIAKVNKLEIDSTANYLDVTSGDLVLVTGQDTLFKPSGGNVSPQSNNQVQLGSSSLRWKDFFAIQTTIGAMFEAGLRTKNIGKLKTGTVVVWRDDKLVPCDSDSDPFVMGVVKEGKDEPIVIGAEPVLVTGRIDVGDFITTSKKIGHGKAVKSGYLLKKDLFGKVIAQSLESGNGSSYTIKCMIRKM